MKTVTLKGTHAKRFNYSHYVGQEVVLTGKEYHSDLVEVQIKVKDVPFGVSLAVHKEDISY
jgi:hypothetical protein